MFTKTRMSLILVPISETRASMFVLLSFESFLDVLDNRVAEKLRLPLYRRCYF